MPHPGASNLHLFHHPSTTLTWTRTRPVAASVVIHLCLQCTEQDERTLSARFSGRAQKVAGPGETRLMKHGAHLCGMHGVLYIWKMVNTIG